MGVLVSSWSIMRGTRVFDISDESTLIISDGVSYSLDSSIREKYVISAMGFISISTFSLTIIQRCIKWFCTFSFDSIGIIIMGWGMMRRRRAMVRRRAGWEVFISKCTSQN